MSSTDPRVERLMRLADEYMVVCSQEDVSAADGHLTRIKKGERPSDKAREALRAALSQALGDSQPVAPNEAAITGLIYRFTYAYATWSEAAHQRGEINIRGGDEEQRMVAARAEMFQALRDYASPQSAPESPTVSER
ncbi:MAG TPA: hypothetical protein VFN11_00725 [Ktedonobacterales bacterium]|nr:hypothetical protein [Ktedonobacterales bacterium]